MERNAHDVPTGERGRGAFGQALLYALPVMVAYVSIGVPCGVLESKAGMSPLMAFVLSATYYSGAGQFMFSRMALAGSPVAAIALTISLMNTRQVLYSVALSPFFAHEKKVPSLAFASTVTDESFGINLDRFSSVEGWDARRGIMLNLLCMVSWATANACGAALGPVIDAPLALLSFGMTSIFICLALSQRLDAKTCCTMAVSCLCVGVAKLLGLGSMAVVIGSVLGIVAGTVYGEVRDHGDA